MYRMSLYALYAGGELVSQGGHNSRSQSSHTRAGDTSLGVRAQLHKNGLHFVFRNENIFSAHIAYSRRASSVDMRSLPSMIAIRLAMVSNTLCTLQASRGSPSRASSGNHVKVFAGLGNPFQTASLLDLNHDLMQNEKGGYSSNTPAI